ncbi:MAG TPA: deoxyuridine 5'-triphosphate nucleotidohydrolase [Thermomicrobiaceae bacterium]|nr:deoxyuridine 5'-triphosphate nucleotidohydrolase [Thermomicrobiaceae bacterium]
MAEPGGVLSREQIVALLGGEPPLLSGMPDPQVQLQPNGVDLTLASVARFAGSGALGRAGTDRRLPETEELPFDAAGWLELAAGPYLVRYNETVNLPASIMAYSPPRSSLLRSGVTLDGAVWDAGYSGQGAGLLLVANPLGFRLQRGARIAQLVFHRLVAATESGYQGVYQGETG